MPTPRKLLSKIKSADQLARILRSARKARRKTRIVFTNGCFDLIHPGHVTYLENARKQGDALVVAVNSDESVSRLKGPERPLNPLADRMQVIAALESVDYVTWFEEDTPREVILQLRPNVLVKGGDWKPEQIVGAAEVRSWGGKVKSLPYVEGKSTTNLVEKARRSSSR